MGKEKWYKDGLKFSCSRCGNCCSGPPGYVWVTKEEIGRISKFLGRSDDWLDKTKLRRVHFRYSLTELKGGDCIFLSREGGKTSCSIHSVRPLQCRTWPFWNDNLRSQKAWEETHRHTCPGMNEGRHHDFVQIETIRTQKKW